MKKRLLTSITFFFICATAFAQAPLTPGWLVHPKNVQSLGNVRYAKSTVVDAAGNIYVTGAYAGITDFDPSATVLDLTSVPNPSNNDGTTPDSQDIFVAKYSNTGALLWVKTAGNYGDDSGTAIALDAADNVYVTGYFRHSINFDPGNPLKALVSEGVDDIFLLKLDANGNFIWSKSMGGSSTDRAYGLALDQYNNIFITGEFWLTANFDPNGSALLTTNGAADIFFAKYDSAGNYIWAKGIGGSSSGDLGNDIAVDPDGNVYLTGSFNETVDFDPAGSAGAAQLTALGSKDIFLAKYDLNGAYVWAKRMGGSGNFDVGNGIALDNQQHVFVTGAYSGTALFHPTDPNASITSNGSAKDTFLAKYDKMGNFIWVKSMGGTSADEGRKVSIDGSVAYLMGNFTYSFYADPNNTNTSLSGALNSTFIAAYNALNGDYIWANGLSGASGDGIAIKNSLFHVVGNFTGTVDFDPSAQTVNLQAVFGATDIFIANYALANGHYNSAIKFGDHPKIDLVEEGLAIAQDQTGNVIVAGKFSGELNFDPSGSAPLKVLNQTGYSPSQDGYVAKYSQSGQYLWARVFGGINEDIPEGVAVDAAGNVYVTGIFQGTAYFDLPSTTTGKISHTGTTTATFIAKYDVNGNFLWVKKVAGQVGTVNARALALGPNNSVYIGGFFKGTANFNPAGSAEHISQGNTEDSFIAKYDTDGNYLWSHRLGGNNNDRGLGIAVNAIGEAYLTGYYDSTILNSFTFSNSSSSLRSKGDHDIFVVKYAEDGSFVWSHSIGGSKHDRAGAIALDNAGDVYITGTFMGKVNFRTAASPYELESDANPLSGSAFVAKITKHGSFVWASAILGSYSWSGGVAVDHQNGVYITGYFGDLGNFGSGVTLTAPTYYMNGFVAKYDANGNIVQAVRLGSSFNTMGRAVSVSANGDVAATGQLRRTLTVGEGASALSSTSINSADMFVVKFQREATLPVAMTKFTATKANNYAKLTWQTASEINNKEFAVLRSADGIVFTELGRIAGAGNSNQLKSYTFNDRSPLNGVNYYKLLQYDLDNKVVNLGVQTVSFSLASEVAVYPNPTANEVQVTLGAHQYRKAKLYNNTGMLLQTVTIVPVQQTLRISLKSYPKGVYVLKLESDTGNVVKKVIKN